jgi:Zn finger protein HypA/HybF involved in hydrogenase expression
VFRLRKTSIATFISKHEIYLLLVTTQAYCVKCKSKRDMKNEKQVTMKNGRRAISGTCSVCGTKMFRIGGGASVAVAKQRPKVKAASRKPTSKAAKTRKSKTKGKR